MASDPELRAHQEWLGYVQPVGLVVSPPALVGAQAHPNRNIGIRQQQILLNLAKEVKVTAGDGLREVQTAIPDLPTFCVEFFGWESSDIAGAPRGPELPDTLSISLVEYGELLEPTYAVPNPDKRGEWLLLIKVHPAGTDLDAPDKTGERQWHASPQARFERLLRETGNPIGVLFNGTELRLVYAPSGESSGHDSFPVPAMCEVAGRPIVAALHMLLSAERLFTVPTAQRLPAILEQSRKYQNEVSVALAEQVLAALNELLRGFQAANEASKGELLREVLAEDPDHVYGGLLASLMRLVFVLYAEDRGLLSTSAVYVNHYSVGGLIERLREDHARYPDTMDQRYGAWSQLLTLFRLIYDGASHGSLHLPGRHGKLFDPDSYPFLEGRQYQSKRGQVDRVRPPRVSDGVVYRVLSNLLVLDGERLSYQALDVEQIGSVYEAMMGFELRVADGLSIGLKPDNVGVNLQDLLKAKGADRAKILRDTAACEIKGEALEKLKQAKSVHDLLDAFGKKISKLTPNVIPPDGMFLQPTDERRRSGSHYTPRSLTEPIVRTTLRPIFERLGEHPLPEEILDLKICDPAMGSGAFLVEASRQLGDKLVEAWNYHRSMPDVPPDEVPQLFARRLVAQRCLYGVDKNPFAVDLAKLSLWLATLAKDHPFTFLDHALRRGDSLVGLTREQIAQFHWDTTHAHPRVFGQEQLEKAIERVTKYRKEILQMREDDEASILLKRQKLGLADQSLKAVRNAADLVIAAFFSGEKDKDREKARKAYRDVFLHTSKAKVDALQGEAQILRQLRGGQFPVIPFHWEVEFPEVFCRENPGFDAFVGNPPFAGRTTLYTSNRLGYLDWLKEIHEESHGNADVVAHFFRRTFNLLRCDGCFGLIATNTIRQGDTRSTGLRWICTHGGTIYAARRRYTWPGESAVVVSIVHLMKGAPTGPFDLDGWEVQVITAHLFHASGHESPAVLTANKGKSFMGSVIVGLGFTFDDTDKKGIASSIAEMHELINQNPKNAECIFPYIGGEEVNTSPTHAHHRYVINFGEMTEKDARRGWPDLMSIVERKVKPERIQRSVGGSASKRKRAERWWLFGSTAKELYDVVSGLPRVLVCAQTSKYRTVTFLPNRVVFDQKLIVFASSSYSWFAVMQSQAHVHWASFMGSTLKDDPVYTPSDCFETFPFPRDLETLDTLEQVGQRYYNFRAKLMVRNKEGLTKRYNRFHEPDECSPDIVELRQLHAAMDRAVLDAYGWTDIQPTCEFLLDYEEEEEKNGSNKHRKKPWRYRWPDDIRDEVLARLLELNKERAAEEALAAKADMSTEKPKTRASRRKKAESPSVEPLLADMLGDKEQ